MKYRIEVDVTSDSLADAVEDAKKILDDLGTYGSLGTAQSLEIGISSSARVKVSSVKAPASSGWRPRLDERKYGGYVTVS